MFQQQLNFLGRTLERLRPQRPATPDPKQPLAWKHGLTVHLVRVPRARRYLLRLQPDGSARLVIPRRGSRREALQFLERSEAWLLQQKGRWQKRHETRQPWVNGSRFLFRGEETVLRTEEIAGKLRLCFADVAIPLTGPQPDYRKPVLDRLRRIAERELPIRTRELADLHHVSISRVTVRGQKTRWGSCSARGTISLNWRLIQAPAFVQDYLIIHELMHRREMNHSARYWKLVEAAFPDYRLAEKWLKKFRLDGDYLTGVTVPDAEAPAS
jgi:predicted metal-dependent hydrolase